MLGDRVGRQTTAHNMKMNGLPTNASWTPLSFTNSAFHRLRLFVPLMTRFTPVLIRFTHIFRKQQPAILLPVSLEQPCLCSLACPIRCHQNLTEPSSAIPCTSSSSMSLKAGHIQCANIDVCKQTVACSTNREKPQPSLCSIQQTRISDSNCVMRLKFRTVFRGTVLETLRMRLLVC